MQNSFANLKTLHKEAEIALELTDSFLHLHATFHLLGAHFALKLCQSVPAFGVQDYE